MSHRNIQFKFPGFIIDAIALLKSTSTGQEGLRILFKVFWKSNILWQCGEMSNLLFSVRDFLFTVKRAR